MGLIVLKPVKGVLRMSAVQIDVFRLSKERGTASGKFTAAELPLLAGHDGQFTEGQVEWSATGTEVPFSASKGN